MLNNNEDKFKLIAENGCDVLDNKSISLIVRLYNESLDNNRVEFMNNFDDLLNKEIEATRIRRLNAVMDKLFDEIELNQVHYDNNH